MNTMLKPSTLLCAAILGVVVLTSGHANADDCDKLPLFNTFYLPGQGGSYALSLRQDRTFTLTDPCGATVCGTIVASDDELALISSDGNRHFAYRFDSANDVVFQPTKKDTPNGATVIGRMAPVGRNNEALFVAAQNASSPVAASIPAGPIVPAVVTTVVRYDDDRRNDRSFDRGNGRGWDRDHDRNNGWNRNRGHYETRTQQVLVEAAHTDRRWVPAQFEVRVDRWGHRENVQVRQAHWEEFQVPARFETREVKVWVEGR